MVVKLLRMEGRENGWLQTRLQEEMRLLARIDHPSVVGILDTGELADGSPFLVIQYVDGESLRDALRSGPLERKRAAGIVRQIGSALNAVHALGIAHRDLKPENIMLQRLADGAETAKLIDFGIAKVDRSDHAPETTTIAIAGTIRYMAPEQFEGKNGPTSDLYSLALIVCELLSGQPDIRALSSKDRRVHRAIEKALAFSPANRPPNVRAWSEELANELSCSTRRIFVKEAGMAVGLLGGGAVAAGIWFDGQRDFSRVVEHTGAFDPLGEGFQIHNELVGTVAENSERTGYDGWQITSTRQGDYYHRLTGPQKRAAIERGWKLSATLRADQGLAYLGVDLAGVGPRFDIGVQVRPDGDLVRLNTQIVPIVEGLDILIPQFQSAYRQYALVFDAGLGCATLFIDGRRTLSGYQGHRQFQKDLGLMFGAALYASPRGIATFQSVRFEVNP